MTKEQEDDFEAFLSRINEEKRKGNAINLSALYLKDILFSLREEVRSEDLLLWLNIAQSFEPFFKALSLEERKYFKEDAEIILSTLKEKTLESPLLYSEKDLLRDLEASIIVQDLYSKRRIV